MDGDSKEPQAFVNKSFVASATDIDSKRRAQLEPPDADSVDTKRARDHSNAESAISYANEKTQITKKADDGKANEPKPSVGFFEVFRFATGIDKLLCFIGIIAAIANGLLQPLTVVIFGNVIDGFADPTQYCTFEQLLSGNQTIAYLFNVTFSLLDMNCTEMVKYNASTLLEIVEERATTLPPDLQLQIDQFLVFANSSGLFQTAISLCQQMIDSQNDFLGQMTEQITYFAIIGAAAWISGYLQATCFGMAAENQVKTIRIAFFKNLLRQDIGWYDAQESGAVTSKFAEDILMIHKGIGDKCALIFQTAAAFAAGMGVAFFKGWQLALVVLSISPLLAVAAVIMMKIAFKHAKDETAAYAKAGAIAQEVLGSIRTVASFGGQMREVERYAVNLEEARKVGTKKGVVLGLCMGFTFFCIFGAYALGFSYGIQLINDQVPGYSIGVVTTTFFAVIIGTFSLGMSVTSIQGYAAARSAAYNVFQVIDRKPKIDAFSKRGKRRPDDDLKCHIEFKNISFKYPTRPDVPILRDVSLEIKPGTTVALVGASGCGKSTIVQLLQRFYDPDAGTVLVDGTDLRDYNLFWFRSLIGSVSQEPILFGTTIYENIRYGFPGVSKQEIEQAAKQANAHDFVTKLPKGYDTLVGEQGAQLSGGQKQRIAIARALVRNPRILLLDEATSALDSESEAIVQDALDRARAGRTTIAIAHRLSTIMNADKIVVIDAGRVHESGTHAELLKLNGLYAKLVEAQQGRDASEIEMEFATNRERRAALVNRQKSAIRDDTPLSPTKESKELVPMAAQGLSAEEKKKQEQALVKQHFSAKRLWKLASPELPHLILGTLGSLLCGAVWPAFSIIFSQMMTAFTACSEQERYEKGLMYSLIFLAIGFTCFVGFTLTMSMFSYAGEYLVARIRKLTFHAMLRQEIAWFDDEDNATGALASRLATQCGTVRDATGAQLAQMVQNVSSLLAAIVIAFIYEWRITLIMLAFLPVLIFAGLVQGKAAGDTVQQDKLIEDAAKYLVQATTNIRTVTSLGAYHIFIELFNKPLKNRHKRELIKVNIASLCFGLSRASMLFAYAAAFYAGAEFIKQGLTDFGSMFTALAAIMFSAFAVGQANAMAPDQRKAQLSVAEIFKLLDRKPVIEWDHSNGKKPASFSGKASVDAVQFHYPTRPTAQILNGLDLTVNPGQTIALVGASGCGKSTVIQLLERFYDPVSGEVHLDDNVVTSLDLSWLRGKMSLVSQEPILFDRTIAENISYGVDGLNGSTTATTATQEEIEAVAKMANIHDFIAKLPEGYQTRVGERGAQLSGGQKQRVAIARALIRQPKLLLLDEATSALDSESEKIVQEALDRARTGRTVVVIAHRLSTIEGADAIAVIQAGVVRELGTHSELLAQKGLYYGLWSAQQLTR